MKSRKRSLLISAALTLGMCFAGAGTSWGADASPPVTGAPSDGQTVVAQAAPATPATTPSATSAATASTTNVPVTEVTVKGRETEARDGHRRRGVSG